MGYDGTFCTDLQCNDLSKYRSPSTEESDVESGTWVTVFGFPPSQASYVLKLFQEIGEVVRHKTPLGQCNWMHIQYVFALFSAKQR